MTTSTITDDDLRDLLWRAGMSPAEIEATPDPLAVQVTLEGGPRRGTYPVSSLRDELWLRHLCGTRNIRLGEALYTYSRTVDSEVIFRFRRCRDLRSE